MGKLDSKIALVTGSGRGIGRGIARAVSEEGARVGIADLSEDRARATCDELRKRDGEAIAIQADVTKPEDVQRMVDTIIDEYGRLDILVNNAGIDTFSLVVDMPLDQWREMLETNLTSVFLCTKAALPTMIENRWGRIINIGSQLGHKGTATMAHYCASKAGIFGFTKSVAYEVAEYGITANVINPGPVETDMLASVPQDWLDAKKAEMPLRRFGKVEEIAPAAVFLATEEAGYTTGITLNICGGDVML